MRTPYTTPDAWDELNKSQDERYRKMAGPQTKPIDRSKPLGDAQTAPALTALERLSAMRFDALDLGVAISVALVLGFGIATLLHV
jgi:hypothetical protein